MNDRAPAIESDARERILSTAQRLFYERGVRAVGIDLIIAEAGVAKASLYRHFRTKDDLVAAFLEREDAEYWTNWDETAERHRDDPRAELAAQLSWIAARVVRPQYRGCPQINAAAEFADPTHPARAVAATHKRAVRERLVDLARRLGTSDPDRLGGQLAVLINGAFVSSTLLDGDEAEDLLRSAAEALVTASA